MIASCKRSKSIFSLLFFLLLSFSFSSFAKGKSIVSELWNESISKEQIANLKKFESALENEMYSKAKEYAKSFSPNSSNAFSESIRNLVLWYKFSSDVDPKDVSFEEISRFANENPFFPNISRIRNNVERVAVEQKVPYYLSKEYFASHPPSSTKSKIYFVESKIAEAPEFKDKPETISEISKIWINGSFSRDEELEFLNQYGNELTESDHVMRIDRLLWDEDTGNAKRIMNLVDENHNKLFAAIIAIKKNPRDIKDIYHSVPRSLRSNELLTYSRVVWYKINSKIDEVIDLILDLEKDQVKHPEKWWPLRHLYAREKLKEKEYKISYKLASRNYLPTNAADFWEAQWTSGWIALRFLDEAGMAYEHFLLLRENVMQPVTISRASYWLGMSAQAMGNEERASYWYSQASQYPVFFYGQLALHKYRMMHAADMNSDIILPEDPKITERDIHQISNSNAAKTAYLLAVLGDKKNASEIFEWLVRNSPTDGQIAVIMKIVNELGDPELDVKISRAASRKNVFFIRDKFHIIEDLRNDQNAELIHAIIKQESGFAASAVSHVGAIGFMQIMPDTAKLLAKDLGIKYSKYKLARNIKYNVALGSYYIKKLINRFDGSELLAIASYNAGPNATRRWINEFYDPRETKDIDKIIDWIELVTYSETRNYIQRIMENLIVYKYLLSRSNKAGN